MRGKPEIFSRPDYSFSLDNAPGIEPRGDETVQITTRQRGSALDLIVAEAMILANSTWGGWLAELGVPGIYRSQASLAPGVKVRMGTQGAAPRRHGRRAVHLGHVAAAPLRRPGQPVADHRLRAPRPHRGAGRAVQAASDAALFSIISAFDAAYASYNGFQSAIERYWTLRYAGAARRLRELDATVMKDGLVRADELPLVFPATGAEGLARGTRVRVRIAATDLLTLDLHAGVVARRDAPPPRPPTTPPMKRPTRPRAPGR